MAEFFVQISSPLGMRNEAEMFRLAYGRDLSAEAHEQLDEVSEGAPIYGWRTVATVDDEALAQRMVSLAEQGFASESALFARVVRASDLSADEINQARRQLEEETSDYGDVLRQKALEEGS